ncbi:hypothetical protein [Streptomyces orinoci]|uniref:Integral membrane protein n=1 Tax=Streptomyces orinoci TaxID=67339 RepID=A0ABV3JPX5_STRON
MAFGALGALGTYSNIVSVFRRSATALGVVAAGEGATLVLALVLVGLTSLGQSSPAAVRFGLWALPAVASLTGAVIAPTMVEMVVFAVTPLAMCVSAEGMGLLARRIVVYRTGVDTEAQRRDAAVVRRLAYHRARAANHPGERARERSERASWRLARQIGIGDASLGGRLLEVQRERVAAGADAALADMFSVPVTSVTAPVTPVTAPVTSSVTPDDEPTSAPGSGLPVWGEVPADPGGVTDDCDAEGTQVSGSFPEGVTAWDDPVPFWPEPAVTAPGAAGDEPDGAEPDDDEAEPLWEPRRQTVTLADVAAVAGVPTPEPGESLSDLQLIVVMRYLRYSAEPPLSYRHAVMAFREAGFVGGEARVRAAWGAVMSHEESAP